MKRTSAWLISISMMAGIAATGAMAGNRPGAVAVTVGGAYYGFDTSRHVDATAMPNIALAYDVTDRLAFEGTVGVLNSEVNTPLDTGQPEGTGAHGFLYTLNGVYRFAAYQIIEPYVTAGIGDVGLKPAGNAAVQQGLVNVGVGAQAFFDPSLALRAEFREIYTTGGSGFNDYLVNMGISYLIGDGGNSTTEEKTL